jgi:hypothetical protein
MKDDNIGSDDFRMEFFTAAGIAAAGGFTVGVGEKVYRYIKSKEPLVVQILDSVKIDNTSRVVVKVSNQTLHGIYLESVTLSKINDDQLAFMEWKQNFKHSGVGFAPFEWMEFEWSPINIAPGEDFHFGIQFAKPSDTKALHGELNITYSRLDQKKPETKTHDFRIR